MKMTSIVYSNKEHEFECVCPLDLECLIAKKGSIVM